MSCVSCLEKPKQINTKRDPSTPPTTVHWVCEAKVLAMSRRMSSLHLHVAFLFCSIDDPSFYYVIVDGNHGDACIEHVGASLNRKILNWPKKLIVIGTKVLPTLHDVNKIGKLP
jgi:hypothetical protein